MHTELEASEIMFLSSRRPGLGWSLLVLLAAAVLAGVFTEVLPGRIPPEHLGFTEMYAGADSLGIKLSDKLKRLAGKSVRMTGFMAPPLKPTLAFFVLTNVPMSICPFCSSDADWPPDIVVVKLDRPVTAVPFDRPIFVEGTLEVGTEMDEETGFVSLVRIRADAIGEESSR